MRDKKDFKKLIKIIEKDDRYDFKHSKMRSTIKITFLPTNETRTVHPGGLATLPLKKWYTQTQLSA